MASFVSTNGYVSINSVDLSDHARSVNLTVEVDEQDNTAHGGGGYRSFLGGLKQWSVEIEWNQDFAASEVDATLWPLLGTSTTIAVRADSGAISATNPEYTGSSILTNYPILDGAVGDVATVSTTHRGTGALTRDTTP